MSIRDLFDKMPETRRDLEHKILEYSSEIKGKIEENPENMRTLESIAQEEYETYKPYIEGSVNQLSGSAGHGIGYLGDIVFYGSAIAAMTNPALAPFMLTGLLLKKINLGMQAPEKLRSLSYAAKTGDKVGAAQNITEGFLSYIPGATILDQGLKRIAQKRMLKKTLYRVNEALGIENKPWYEKLRENLSGKYKDVKDRRGNIISPRKLEPAMA